MLTKLSAYGPGFIEFPIQKQTTCAHACLPKYTLLCIWECKHRNLDFLHALPDKMTVSKTALEPKISENLVK